MSTAAADVWEATSVSLDEIVRELGALRAHDEGPALRTSVMTHIAWIPPEWVEAARATFAGMGELYPSRTILLLAEPEAEDGLDARVSTQCFPAGAATNVCTEVVELRLRGSIAEAPASLVAPLLLPDLPVFLRWRGELPFGARPFVRLASLVDRLVVDSREWRSVPEAYGRLAELFSDHLAVSDIVWTRTLRWRAALAGRWPAIASTRNLRVVGPPADAFLLAGWLRSRLHPGVELELEPAGEVEGVEVDGEPIVAAEERAPTSSELLSAELDRFGRDLVYEAAVRAAA